MTDRIRTKFAPTLITDEGHFSGYGAIFGNVDSHGDVIERGAFRVTLEKWRAKSKLPAMRLMHGSSGNPFRFDNLPVGKWTLMREDTTGLWVEGELLALNTDQGRRIHSLMSASVLDGLSIGFVPVRTRSGTGKVRRILVELDLRELSIVDEPSNDLARIAQLSPYDAATERLRAAITNAGSNVKSDYDGACARLQAALSRVATEN